MRRTGRRPQGHPGNDVHRAENLAARYRREDLAESDTTGTNLSRHDKRELDPP